MISSFFCSTPPQSPLLQVLCFLLDFELRCVTSISRAVIFMNSFVLPSYIIYKHKHVRNTFLLFLFELSSLIVYHSTDIEKKNNKECS